MTDLFHDEFIKEYGKAIHELSTYYSREIWKTCENLGKDKVENIMLAINVIAITVFKFLFSIDKINIKGNLTGRKELLKQMVFQIDKMLESNDEACR